MISQDSRTLLQGFLRGDSKELTELEVNPSTCKASRCHPLCTLTFATLIFCCHSLRSCSCFASFSQWEGQAFHGNSSVGRKSSFRATERQGGRRGVHTCFCSVRGFCFYFRETGLGSTRLDGTVMQRAACTGISFGEPRQREEVQPHLHQQEPKTRASHRAGSKQNFQLWLLAKASGPCTLNINDGALLCLVGPGEELRDRNLIRGIDLTYLSHNTVLSSSQRILHSKWEKMELCDPLGQSPPSY